MSLNTSLKGRLRNTDSPKRQPLLPLFEAVVNSIQSIGSISKMPESFIKIKIIRSQQTLISEDYKNDIVGFEIIDNGIGFNEDNFNSFKTLDSEYKIELGCRGIGRLLWIKAFDNVHINSTYAENESVFTRKFDFNVTNNIHNIETNETQNVPIETTVALQRIQKEYSKKISSKSLEDIAISLFEHCLWYFIRKGFTPKITLEDGDREILLNEYKESIIDSSESIAFTIKSEKFEITHIKLKSAIRNKNSIIFSAADRVVKEDHLNGKIPGLFGILKEENGDSFSYICFVTSDYLTKKVNPERDKFNISETTDSDLFDELSWADITEKIIVEISVYLERYLVENKRLSTQRITEYVDRKAPRYKVILDKTNEIVDPSISDKDLELKLHSHLATLESQLLAEGHDLLSLDNIDSSEDYSKKIGNYLSKATDLKRSDLANYISHRRVILDLVRKAIRKNVDGKYAKEDVLHKLIMPMQTTSDDIKFEDSNLWLIDERLAFHNFLASDKPLSSIPITQSDSNKEPDILGLNIIYDNPILVNEGDKVPLASISIIEIKRPMRNDAKAGEDKDPIEQALGYLNRVRSGKVQTKDGRPIPNSDSIPGFCYIICDITDTIKHRCEMFNLRVTSDKLEYFGYNDNYKAYIEVISFDRLISMATERNRAFFDKLGLPST